MFNHRVQLIVWDKLRLKLLVKNRIGRLRWGRFRQLPTRTTMPLELPTFLSGCSDQLLSPFLRLNPIRQLRQPRETPEDSDYPRPIGHDQGRPNVMVVPL